MTSPRLATRRGISSQAMLPRLPIVFLAMLASLLDGCMFRALKADLAVIKTLASVQGRVRVASHDMKPIIVVLMQGDKDEVVDAFTLVRPGSYFFVVHPGTYRVGAFVDSNSDLRLDASERSAWFGTPRPVEAVSGRVTDAIDIDLDAHGAQPMGVALSTPAQRDVKNLPEVKLGEIAGPMDERFSDANGDLGLWQPVEFVTQGLAGIYFMEEYDPDKIPVLYIHGAHGTPKDWQVLAPHLDHKRFQPWLVSYPSGVRLEVAARGILRWLAVLHTRYPFKQLVIIAHSMGGIVARSAINQWFADVSGERVATLERFITISTPWNGHSAAVYGVENAPAVIPSWIDMQPDGVLLSGLYKSDLPEECEYDLLFSYGGGSMMYSEANDGTVALTSQLTPAAQNAAKMIHGFNEDHESILYSKATLEVVNRLLATIE